jgi:hypothetical protein
VDLKSGASAQSNSVDKDADRKAETDVGATSGNAAKADAVTRDVVATPPEEAKVSATSNSKSAHGKFGSKSIPKRYFATDKSRAGRPFETGMVINDYGTMNQRFPENATLDFAGCDQSQRFQGLAVWPSNGLCPMYAEQNIPISIAPTSTFSMSSYGFDPSVAQLESFLQYNSQSITSIKRTQMILRQQQYIVEEQIARLEAMDPNLRQS